MTVFLAGIFDGIVLFHFTKVCPSFVGSSGAITGELYSPVIVSTTDPPSVSNLIENILPAGISSSARHPVNVTNKNVIRAKNKNLEIFFILSLLLILL